MIRRAFLKRMAFAALACPMLYDLVGKTEVEFTDATFSWVMLNGRFTVSKRAKWATVEDPMSWDIP